MIKISGLEKISRELKEAQNAISELDGELGTITFDPNDPGSIERAILEVEQLVDLRLRSDTSNAIIESLAVSLKEKYRQAILDRASAARGNEGTENHE